MIFQRDNSARIVKILAALLFINAIHYSCWAEENVSISQKERRALIDLYISTDGPNWNSNKRWLGKPGTECEWEGIRCNCNPPQPTIEYLWLGSNGLRGRIPATLDSLTHLEGIDLGENQLSGSIPSSLGNLQALEELDLSSNQLTGRIPPELGELKNLTWLGLSGNMLAGSIPSTFGNLVNLRKLHLNANQLMGRFPSALISLESLESLDLNSNQLTGSIPPELGKLVKLKFLDLSGNQFSGNIPPALNSLINLKSLELQANQLSGAIPTQFADLNNLDKLDLSYNSLYTNDPRLLEFLNKKHPKWQNTQTTAPAKLSATARSNSSILVSWTPSTFVTNTTRYELYQSTRKGGPYTMVGSVHAHFGSSFVMDHLKPATTYYIAVRTVTGANGFNKNNTVTSEYSAEISAVTSSDAPK